MSDVTDVDVDVYVFADSEPEDAWHPEDSIPELVRNLLARAVLLDGLRSEGDDTVQVVGNIIRRAEEALTVRGLGDRARLRANQILDDAELVLFRVRAGK